MNSMNSFRAKALTACSGGVLLALLLFSGIDPDNEDDARVGQIDEFMERFGSRGRQDFNKAVKNWPICLTNHTSDRNRCMDWSDDNLNFSLIAVKDSSGFFTPLIESSIRAKVDRNKVIIHLSGGTDLPPFGHSDDHRADALEFFHTRGYLFSSVGYWGSRFRTNLQKSEIDLATRDLKSALDYYRTNCSCNPIIVAESLGASILFNYMIKYSDFELRFIAVAPGMLGVPYSIRHFRIASSSQELALERATAYIYSIADSGPEQFVKRRTVRPIEHLEAFAFQRETAPPQSLLNSECPRFIIGSNDPQNADFEERHLPSIIEIEGAEHDVYREDTDTLRRAFARAMSCIEIG